jgi:AcrR family transcriptional regulator
MSRRDELLEATVEYILEHGVGHLSLRPLAKATGTKARLLIYHFGSREKLIEAALTAALRRVQVQFLESRAGILEFWQWATAPKNRRYLRLVFEVHGLAPRNPRLFGGYVREAIRSWKAIIVSRGHTEVVATLVVAAFDGLLMDYLATGDRQRTTKSLRLFLKKIGGKL